MSETLVSMSNATNTLFWTSSLILTLLLI